MQDVGRTREEFVNHELQSSGVQMLRVFYQHPRWFISLQPIETCDLLLLYNVIQKTCNFSVGLPVQ